MIDDRPASWVAMHEQLLPAHGTALDIACGRGRHALWLAERGLTVHAVDRDRVALAYVQEEGRRRRLPLTTALVDLEDGASQLGEAAFDVIVVVHYLHRPLFPALTAALRCGGLLIYETFTAAQAARGRPTNPAFLLNRGELPELVRPLEVLEWREGVFDDRDVASVVARRV